MNDARDLVTVVIDVDDYVLDQRSQDALLQARVGVRRMPRATQVGLQAFEVIRVRRRRLAASSFLVELGLQCANLLQRLVPAPLQLGRDQAVVRFHRVILPVEQRRGVTSRFHLQRKRLHHFLAAVRFLGRDQPRGVHHRRPHHEQHLSNHGRVHRQSAEGNALRLQAVEPAALTLIAGHRRILARVGDQQLASTATAPQQAGEQGRAALRRPAASFGPELAGIVVEHVLYALELVPRNVPVVMFGNQHGPFMQRFAYRALVENPVDDVRLSGRAPVSVGAGVRRFLQDRDHGVVSRPPPPGFPARHAATLGRQIDAVLDKPLRRLARTPQLEELGEDQFDGVLHPQVGVLLQTLIRGLDKADGRLDDQLSAPGLRPPGFQRTLAQQVELVLAHYLTGSLVA